MTNTPKNQGQGRVRRPACILAGALLCQIAAALPALAQPQGAPGDGPWGEPHLNIVPRSDDEAARITGVTAPADDFTAPEKFEQLPAGAATKKGIFTRDAFSFPSANMPFESEMDFKVGNGFFRRLWVTAPASTQASDGLGPLFNARGCQDCHLKDGRGHPPLHDGDQGVSMFLRLSRPVDDAALDAQTRAWLTATPDPVYGGQLQDKSIAGIAPEGQMQITYTPLPVTLGDGTVVELRRPDYAITDAQYGPIAPDMQISPRVAPQMIGLGLLEAVPEADILAHADPDDADGDGISGRPNVVWSDEFDQWMLGRFGHKAGAPTIRAQSAAAFSGDMGLSSSLHPAGWGECSETQTDCRAAPDGASPQYDDLEVPDEVLDLVTFYSRNLAVPERRGAGDAAVLRGKDLFYQAGCAACHSPKFVTHRLADRPEQSFQLIWPYSDLLLHDMGEGLADDRPEVLANGREWRTAPLWGIGLTETVSDHTLFLHDGRARNLTEAILWHGGEAEAARDAFAAMDAADRADIISFLELL